MNSYPALSGDFVILCSVRFRWYHRTGNLTWHVFFFNQGGKWFGVRQGEDVFSTKKKSTPRRKTTPVVFFWNSWIFWLWQKKSLSDTFFLGGEGKHGVDKKRGDRKKSTTTFEQFRSTNPTEAFCWPSDGRMPLVPGWAWVIYKVPNGRFGANLRGAGCWLVASWRFAVGIPAAQNGEILVGVEPASWVRGSSIFFSFLRHFESVATLPIGRGSSKVYLRIYDLMNAAFLLMDKILHHLGCIKTLVKGKEWDKLPTWTGEFTGFLVAINSIRSFFRWSKKTCRAFWLKTSFPWLSILQHFFRRLVSRFPPWTSQTVTWDSGSRRFFLGVC